MPKSQRSVVPNPTVGMVGEAVPSPRPRGARLAGIDVLRGVVMALMALDHARDFVGNVSVDPLSLPSTTPALFFTRWVTHFCAPVFVFLAGTSAWLYGRGRSPGELSRFLLARGLWLIFLEFTLVRFAWAQSLDASVWIAQVIAAIGFAMVSLAVFVKLPLKALVALGFLIAAGHNALDGLDPSDFTSGIGATAWVVAHEGGPLSLGSGRLLLIVYPLLPWVGVIALGYVFGAWLTSASMERLEPVRRRRRVAALGLALCALLGALRYLNGYGEPGPWEDQPTAVQSVMAFVNLTKYPPSLQFLAMTLGPALLLLAALDSEPRRIARFFQVLGRVPLFFYVAHILALSTFARLLHGARTGSTFRVFDEGLTGLYRGQPLPPEVGDPLWAVYAAWIAVVLLLYPACVAYGRLKRRGRSRWWSYV